MAKNLYAQDTVDGKSHSAKRSVKQGRKPSGLGKPKLVRLYAEDEVVLCELKDKLGYLYNENEIIRSALHLHLSSSVYMELLNH